MPASLLQVDLVRLCLVLMLTLISGWADSQGFVHASTIWVEGRLQPEAMARSAVGFGVGIAAYWLALRFLTELGLVAPELQALLWFALTIIGVAVTSGVCLSWRPLDQVISGLVLCGLGWLLSQTGRS
jgi:hypothetical protein